MKKVLCALIIILLLSIFSVSAYPLKKFSLINQAPRLQFYQSNFQCEDTDIPAYNPFMAGAAIIKSFPWSYSWPSLDNCKDIYLLEETYCGINRIEKVLINCKVFGDFACYSGECIPTTFIPGWDEIPHN